MLKFIKCLLIVFLFNIVCNIEVQAAIINAKSCSSADVQAAINSSSDGDTVNVPSGTCKWTSTVTIPDTKGIILKGAGIDSTIIQDGTGDSSDVLVANVTSGRAVTRITGFTFNGQNVDKTGTQAQVRILGDGLQFRIDHCKITNFASRGIVTSGYLLYGVIDHCIIKITVHTAGIAVFGAGSQDETPWTAPIALGTYKAIYVEDNTFNFSIPGDGVLDGYGGGRYVVRHNTINGSHLGHHGCDSGNYRSCFSWEIYENTFSNTGTSQTPFHSRGGTGVIYNNTYTGNYNLNFKLSNYRSCDSYGVWGQCDGKNPLDKNKDKYGYPCLDQNGRTTNQALSPAYEWGNTLNGSDIDFKVRGQCANELQVIKENRDYYNDTQKPGYTPYQYPHPLTTGKKDEVPPASPNLNVF